MIGGLVTNMLAIKGYDVTVFDNLTYEGGFFKPVNFIYGDVTNDKALASAMEGQDLVIRLSDIVGDAACAISPSRTKAINIKSLEFIVNNFDGKIVSPSSCSIYGYFNGVATEDTPPNPLSLYAEAKVFNEEFLKQKSRNFFSPRFGTVYGLSEAFVRARLDLIVNNMTFLAHKSGVLSVGADIQYRPLISCYDAAASIVYAIENDIQGIYNVCNDNLTSLEVAQAVRRIVPDTQIVVSGEKFEDNRSYQASNEKWRAAAKGFDFKNQVKDGIKDVYEALRDRRIKNPGSSRHFNAAYLSDLKIKGEF